VPSCLLQWLRSECYPFFLLDIDEISCLRLYVGLRQLCTVMFDTFTEDCDSATLAKRDLVFAGE